MGKHDYIQNIFLLVRVSYWRTLSSLSLLPANNTQNGKFGPSTSYTLANLCAYRGGCECERWGIMLQRWGIIPGGNLSFQDTGLCHSNRKSTTHKSGKLSQKYTYKSGKISQKYTHKSGEFLKIIPINPGMPKKLINN